MSVLLGSTNARSDATDTASEAVSVVEALALRGTLTTLALALTLRLALDLALLLHTARTATSADTNVLRAVGLVRSLRRRSGARSASSRARVHTARLAAQTHESLHPDLTTRATVEGLAVLCRASNTDAALSKTETMRVLVLLLRVVRMRLVVIITTNLLAVQSLVVGVGLGRQAATRLL
jgi:hypothetical protein